ncbi:dephospho-CoA kinase [Allofrancisella guangzhouensis]|uniref:Dephospho-CoA kinase n=1 Tax=Allofrancisella guangzhouensis TaxID=594679 RepID=A0A0A8E3Z6_9GAMM|nr:dephospho-CoA kinase [Allofrancisella guangzhouensis]AJC48718.1 dephospho-CoA kinase [Allofrancisella guangzhouensis]MBK2027403.1 dephospho-CoA kinase [Allofrancisella guangzhouensis]MBK2044273.1 dephospho-CoA kinase [Allofrancisella guangzhouensis]MBK2045181.1 dephospho-CoA kinase [Allofrancisella guangzhouensis]
MTNIDTYPIGITGGIASGKSTATKILKERLNINVVCADTISREITRKPSVIKNIAEKFGNDIITNKQINRAMLRAIITESKEAKKWLEDFLHPVINREIKKQVKESPTALTIVDIPLLGPYNIRHYDYLKKVIVIKADLETRIKRLMERDGKDRQQAVAFINLQISDQEREKIADYVVDNSSLNDLELENRLTKVINDITTLD